MNEIQPHCTFLSTMLKRVCIFLFCDRSQMMERYNTAKQNGVAVSAMWIQDWAGVLKTSFGSRLFWDWKWNKDLYPGNNLIYILQ
mgnify:CR=1 FL=1